MIKVSVTFLYVLRSAIERSEKIMQNRKVTIISTKRVPDECLTHSYRLPGKNPESAADSECKSSLEYILTLNVHRYDGGQTGSDTVHRFAQITSFVTLLYVVYR
jgi:hypothetical protein